MKSHKYKLSVLIALFLLCHIYSSAGEYGTVHPVSVVTDEKDSETVISLKNRTPGSYTVTVYFKKLLNAETDKPMPYTTEIAGNRTERCITVRQVDRTKPWENFFMYDFQPGALNAKHDENAVYSLPYRAGEEYTIMQGYGGKYTHKNEFYYSLDWYMPIGSEVLAARNGIVIEAVDNFDGHGLKPYFYNRNNQVLIEHNDGTIARYVHFRKGGVKVKTGDSVKAGDLIGLSGDVGYSNAAHLHFSVHRAIDGKRSESIPVKFRVSDKEIKILKEKETYRAWEKH